MQWDLIIDAWNFPIEIVFKRSATPRSNSAAPVEEIVEEQTYSGIDSSFYDSPSGETITEFSQVTKGTGPSIFTPAPAPAEKRKIYWWELAVVALIAGPLRILRFPWVIIDGAQFLVEQLPAREQDMAQ